MAQSTESAFGLEDEEDEEKFYSMGDAEEEERYQLGEDEKEPAEEDTAEANVEHEEEEGEEENEEREKKGGEEEGEEEEEEEGEEEREEKGGGEDREEEEKGGREEGGGEEWGDNEEEEEGEEGEKDTGEEESGGEDMEEAGSDIEYIASEIMKAIVAEAMQESHSGTSLDSRVLQELKESEDNAIQVAEKLAKKKKEIEELRKKQKLTAADAKAIEDKQAEIQDLVESLQHITDKIKELLEGPFRPSTHPMLVHVCPICERDPCTCEECVCKPDVCACEKEPYLAGKFYEYQVDPYPLKKKKKELCKCGKPLDECICKRTKSEEECTCKREDLAKFDIIADVMPKVVVCAPDIKLPRIIVCEPYTPKKVRSLRKCY